MNQRIVLDLCPHIGTKTEGFSWNDFRYGSHWPSKTSTQKRNGWWTKPTRHYTHAKSRNSVNVRTWFLSIFWTYLEFLVDEECSLTLNLSFVLPFSI